VTQVEHAAVEVEVEQLVAVEVPEPVAFAPVDHERDADGGERVDAVGGEMPVGRTEHGGLGCRRARWRVVRRFLAR